MRAGATGAAGALTQPEDGIAASRPSPSRFPEIDCIRPMLAPGVIAAAEDRAVRTGFGADRALIGAGAVSEDDFLRVLGTATGVPFEPLNGASRNQCPLSDERLIDAAAAGLLPLTDDDGLCLVVAPRGTAARRLLRLIADDPAQARRFCFTSAARLNGFVLRHAARAVIARATDRLAEMWPMLSAAPVARRDAVWPGVGLLLLILVALLAAPTPTVLVCELMLAAVFLAWLGLRLFCATLDHGEAPPIADGRDDALPVYTVIVALYREAASVGDYPREKLDLIVAVEADDHETRAALAARKNRIPVTVIPVPHGGPRTKPKALNVALPFAQGTFTAVYDAEDRPEPDQLRRALQAFATGGDDLACVQARLCIDNTDDGCLARGLR